MCTHVYVFDFTTPTILCYPWYTCGISLPLFSVQYSMTKYFDHDIYLYNYLACSGGECRAAGALPLLSEAPLHGKICSSSATPAPIACRRPLSQHLPVHGDFKHTTPRTPRRRCFLLRASPVPAYTSESFVTITFYLSSPTFNNSYFSKTSTSTDLQVFTLNFLTHTQKPNTSHHHFLGLASSTSSSPARHQSHSPVKFRRNLVTG